MRPSLRIMDEELLGRIVDEAKRVLAEVGMEIRGAEMRRRLLEHGLPLDHSGTRVLFPRDVVEAAIASAPSSFTLYDREGNPHAELGGDDVHFVPGSSGLKVQDHRTGETRLANSTDFTEYVRLGHGLEHIPYLATAFSTNDDIEAQVSDAWRLYMILTNTTKPVVSGRVHRARRAPDGRDDGAVPGRTAPTSSPARCRSSRSPRPATSGTARTPART